jgi:hypothetical protein
MGDGEKAPLRLQFNPKVRLEFHGSTITSDAGLLPLRELDEALGLTSMADDHFQESRTGRNIQHHLVPLLRQSIYSRLAGYDPGNVHSADGWQEFIEPIVEGYLREPVRLLFRGDAAFAKPELYEYLEARSIGYAIRLPANQVLERAIAHLLVRPTECPSQEPVPKSNLV